MMAVMELNKVWWWEYAVAMIVMEWLLLLGVVIYFCGKADDGGMRVERLGKL